MLYVIFDTTDAMVYILQEQIKYSCFKEELSTRVRQFPKEKKKDVVVSRHVQVQICFWYKNKKNPSCY